MEPLFPISDTLPDAPLWRQRYARIAELFEELRPVIRQIRAADPACMSPPETPIDVADGFSRLEDQVGNFLMGPLGMFLHRQDVRTQAAIQHTFFPRHAAIFAQAKDLVSAHGSDPQTLRLVDDLQWAMQEAMDAVVVYRPKNQLSR